MRPRAGAMTSIKPPQSPSAGPIEPGAALPEAGPPRSTGSATGPAGVTPGQASAPSDPIAALAADVQAGRIGMNDAVEQLVERTVARMGARLSAEERAELGAMLREALESDPVLSSLR
jgi:hypothetical protein